MISPTVQILQPNVEQVNHSLVGQNHTLPAVNPYPNVEQANIVGQNHTLPAVNPYMNHRPYGAYVNPYMSPYPVRPMSPYPVRPKSGPSSSSDSSSESEENCNSHVSPADGDLPKKSTGSTVRIAVIAGLIVLAVLGVGGGIALCMCAGVFKCGDKVTVEIISNDPSKEEDTNGGSHLGNSHPSNTTGNLGSTNTNGGTEQNKEIEPPKVGTVVAEVKALLQKYKKEKADYSAGKLRLFDFKVDDGALAKYFTERMPDYVERFGSTTSQEKVDFVHQVFLAAAQEEARMVAYTPWEIFYEELTEEDTINTKVNEEDATNTKVNDTKQKSSSKNHSLAKELLLTALKNNISKHQDGTGLKTNIFRRRGNDGEKQLPFQLQDDEEIWLQVAKYNGFFALQYASPRVKLLTKLVLAVIAKTKTIKLYGKETVESRIFDKKKLWSFGATAGDEVYRNFPGITAEKVDELRQRPEIQKALNSTTVLEEK